MPNTIKLKYLPFDCLFLTREGNVTRHDPEEHWEDQEASKQ